MSRVNRGVEIVPPEWVKVGRKETETVGGFRCPMCLGEGVLWREERGRDYNKVRCETCEGTGGLVAEVTICWKAKGVDE